MSKKISVGIILALFATQAKILVHVLKSVG